MSSQGVLFPVGETDCPKANPCTSSWWWGSLLCCSVGQWLWFYSQSAVPLTIISAAAITWNPWSRGDATLFSRGKWRMSCSSLPGLHASILLKLLFLLFFACTFKLLFLLMYKKTWPISFALNVQIGWHKSHQQKAPRWNSGSSPLSVSKSCCNLGESKSCNKWKRFLCCVLLNVC